MLLYHGSDVAVERPDVSFNAGFADLGRGFYLTDDADVARQRARSRARKVGVPAGMVSVFAFDEDCVPWATWGAEVSVLDGGRSEDSFGLRFEASPAGIVAWADYIKACRAGRTEVADLGDPAVVRAWIATEEIEMVCSGLADARDLAEFVDPAELVVQYCLISQELIDRHLSFVEARAVDIR